MIKKMKSFYLIFLFPFGCFSQQASSKNPANELFKKSDKVEKDLIKNNQTIDFGTVNEIICLTQIYPKKVDGSYIGIIYYPTLEEVKLWKNWFEKYKFQIQYKIKQR